MSSVPVESVSNSASALRLTCDMVFAILFLATLTVAIADSIVGRLFAASGEFAATLVLAWAARGMLKHLDRWSANWDE